MFVVIVAVSYYPERRATLPDDWAVWATTTPIPETYATLARVAYEEGWDREMIVVQDDVRFSSMPDSDAELVVYGQSNGRHVCPRAFAATPTVWRHLAKRWRPNAQVCEAWQPIVARFGKIMDVTTHG